MTDRAFLGLGSNLGDRLANLQRAVELLAGTKGVRVSRSSRVFETEAIGPEQPEFLNAVVEVHTELPPLELLAACQAVEAKLGRVREQRWGPRTIDVDLLNFDERTIDEPDLVVPHPRLHERAFALVPLLELEPAPMLPGGVAVADARPGGDVVVVEPPLEIPA